MEVIEDTFFQNSLSEVTDIWNFITLENIDVIYDTVLEEQKKAMVPLKIMFHRATGKRDFALRLLKNSKGFYCLFKKMKHPRAYPIQL